jgi:hypothetical protein
LILQFLCEPFIALAEFLVKLFPTFPRFDALAAALDPIAYVVRFLDFLSPCKRFPGVCWSSLLSTISNSGGLS